MWVPPTSTTAVISVKKDAHMSMTLWFTIRMFIVWTKSSAMFSLIIFKLEWHKSCSSFGYWQVNRVLQWPVLKHWKLFLAGITHFCISLYRYLINRALWNLHAVESDWQFLNINYQKLPTLKICFISSITNSSLIHFINIILKHYSN